MQVGRDDNRKPLNSLYSSGEYQMSRATGANSSEVATMVTPMISLNLTTRLFGWSEQLVKFPKRV